MRWRRSASVHAGEDPGPAAEPCVGHFLQRPGVSFQERGDDPATVINIRGLQDFGRVAVVVDGARQNYQRTGHNANGSFFLDPELIGGVDVVRGPTANIYGSGAIGGVVSFRTKDIDDVVRPGERWGVDMSGSYGSNKDRGMASVFGGVRADPNVDVFGGAVLSHPEQLQGRRRHRDRQHRQRYRGRLDEGDDPPGRRPRVQDRRRLPGLPVQYRSAEPWPDHDGGTAGGDRGLLGLRFRCRGTTPAR